MLKKFLVIFLSAVITLSATGCGGTDDLYKSYITTQPVEIETMSYGEKSLSTSVINFADVETPESLYAVFGETETGRPDVQFIDRARKIDDKIVIGVKVGKKPRMAGVYVEGFGYYFIKDTLKVDTEYAIALKGVPFGTFKFIPFGVVEDEVVLSSESLSFTNEGPVFLEGEKDEEFTLELGTVKVVDESYVSASDLSFGLAKNSIFSTGEVTATIKGDAGVALSVYGTRATDISKASYIYVGVKGGRATVIRNQSWVEEVLGEVEISNYSQTEAYALKIQVGETDIKLLLNDQDLLTVTESITPNRNLGFKTYSQGSAIGEIVYPEYTLESYKTYAQNELENLVNVKFYKVIKPETPTYDTCYVTSEPKDYRLTRDDVKSEFDRAIKNVNDSTTIEDATAILTRSFEKITELVLESYRTDAKNSLEPLASDWYEVFNMHPDVVAYMEKDIDDNGDGFTDVRIGGDIFNVDLTHVIDAYTYDHRWWIPRALWLPEIKSNITKEIDNCSSKILLDFLYEDFAVELIRSTCQKAIEVFYAIKAYNVPTFDGNEKSILWEPVWCYNEVNMAASAYVYKGPVSKYYGTPYQMYRLSPLFYKPGEMKNGVADTVYIFKQIIEWISTGNRPW
ncbi:MAG: hypothetical protein E7369_02965 [Clostridiales bacterium]|nr:hypothetical protein [Clostridiales bacterium]